MTGCNNIAAQKAELVQQAPPCCAGLSAQAATPWQPRPFSVQIPEHGPVLAFSTGNSRYAIVDLAGSGKPPQHLALASGAWPQSLLGTGRWAPVFFPAATFADAQWRVLVTLDNTEQSPGSCAAGASCSTRTLDVAVPIEARYLVIHTPGRLVGATEGGRPTGGVAASSIYRINGAFVSVGGGLTTERTVGMSYGSVEVLPVEFPNPP
ncbi:hypothetical protein GCM10009107_43590 [Ideonella azotifigens]|uniref:Uncharacterized protein n=2 Tax=Ideonella azotifigens TaxID=513160 RepID=A0ABN1KAX9_9BURK